MRRRWTEGERAYLCRHYADTHTRALAERLGRTEGAVHQRARALGLWKSSEFMAECTRRVGPGRQTQFAPGNKPWNAGREGWRAGGRSGETRFRLGHMPQTWVPIGTERRDKDGLLKRKVADTRDKKTDWRHVHHLVYEEHHGAIPDGCIVVFADRNQRNLDPANLIAITRADNARRNSIYRYPPELRELMRVNARLKREIREHEESDGRPA